MEIYIDEKDRLDASVAANAFAKEDIRNRAYINTLGAELALKYLASENIDISDVYNIHSIKKILEDTDISDIMLKNIHIDVRVVFDENVIFIPKSHFEYNIVPDIYLVFKQSKDYSEFLGFFEPKLINKNNANSDYYFIEKEKLNSPFDLKNFVNNFKGNTDEKLSDDEMANCEQIIISMADNDISDKDKRYLFERLKKSAELREKFIEYENFETLSYKAMTDSSIVKKQAVLENDFSDFEAAADQFDFDETEISEDITDDDISDNIEDLTGDIVDDVEDIADFEEQDIEEEGLPEEGFEESLEDISDINIENIVDEEVSEPELLSFDSLETHVEDIQNVELPSDEEPLETFNFDENIIEAEVLNEDAVDENIEGLENVENLENINDPESLENLESIDELIETSDMEDVKISDEIPTDMEELSEASDEVVENNEEAMLDENHSDIQTEVLEETTPDNIVAEEVIEDEIFESLDVNLENSEENEALSEENAESFGNNLMENLQAENMDQVSLEVFNEEAAQEDVSESDLLSEIDNILNTDESSHNQENIEEELPPTIESIDEIPDISELTSDIVVSSEDDAEKDNSLEDGLNMDDLIEESTELEVLYDENHPQPELPQEEVQIPGAALYTKQPADNKKTLILAAALVVVLAVGAFTMFNKNKGGDESYTPDTSAENSMNESIMNENTPGVVTPQKNIEVEQPSKELKNDVTTASNQAPQAYMSVNRLVWDVPDSLSYSKGVQTYLRTAGKSIKLSLSADLLLATEFAYTNSVKVGLKLSNDGSIREAKMISGSGSTQIDNIVLQSVKDTLNVVKPASGAVNTPEFNLNLIIYF